ncbi:four-carbon acid sugar kinase family protein [Variovorax saccharolyticus]|uniref:four-carbon acid sugar kinase family protein n=1 Tax=Variovorax saccharolyticus TaxID=3053516 RepID=UPI0025763636|nr:four-carbon acid sugar kinase family protein [Variovorax sp. J22R187]MDM0021981.1 four-carbon acid sugar kinase family protein [Variovorax sp. J22R187]
MSQPASPAPAIVYYGDDFTGATDTLATGARAGLRTLLFLKVPTLAQMAAAGPLDCLGIAGAARSMAPDEMRAELAPVAALFRRLGARVLHYKTCSTFDSAPDVGSIGVAVDALRPAVDTPWAAIVGGQPDLERYCLFGNLFAAAGSGGAVHRLDRHPTMSRHPVTPMHEADLRLHLAGQGMVDVLTLPYPAYANGGPALQGAFDARVAAAPAALLFDVAENAHLQAIGGLLGPRAEGASLLAVGPSSVVQAFAPRYASGPPAPRTVAAARGPVLALAGSLSPVTAGQVAAARSFQTVWLDPQQLVASTRARAEAVARVSALLAQGLHVLACTVQPGSVPASDSGVPARALARAGGEVLAGVLAAVPLSRVGIAGGDTSSHAVQALDAWGLSYEAALAPGVALCRLHSESPALDGLEIALKGGQMGGEDFFERLVHGTPRGEPATG